MDPLEALSGEELDMRDDRAAVVAPTPKLEKAVTLRDLFT